jgi:hypothetical protein
MHSSNAHPLALLQDAERDTDQRLDTSGAKRRCWTVRCIRGSGVAFIE